MDGDPFHLSRRWLVFFREREPYWWFDRFLEPGFRHVSVAAWYDRAERWVFLDPCAASTALLVLPPGVESDCLIGQWARQSGAVVAFTSRQARPLMPPFFGCVGAIKALLGIETRALTPWALHRDLMAAGAEVVPVPCVGPDEADEPSSAHGEPVQA